MALPIEEGRFVLDCDVSDFEIGAVLSYNVTRKELLALITFVKKFKQYLLGRPFTIRTDHAALQWLKRTPEPIGQQARWLEILEKFDYEVQHRSGAKHCNAETVSTETVTAVTDVTWRLNSQQKNSRQTSCQPMPQPDIVPVTDWVKIQMEDPDLRFICQLVSNGSLR